MISSFKRTLIQFSCGAIMLAATIVLATMLGRPTESLAANSASSTTSVVAETEAETKTKADASVASTTSTKPATNGIVLGNYIVVSEPDTESDSQLTDEPTPTEPVVEQAAEVTPEPTSPYADLLDDIDADDREVLKRLIYHESRGNGGEAVAEVVLNRMQDSRFPSTLQEVVYAPNQFTPASFLFSADIREPDAMARCGEIVEEVLSPNYERTIPSNYVYFNSIGPGSSDYEWRGGNVFYAG